MLAMVKNIRVIVQITSYIISWLLTLTIFCLLGASFFTKVLTLSDRLSSWLMFMGRGLLFISLVLLLVREFLDEERGLKAYVTASLLITASLYAFSWSLRDISLLTPYSFIYIPPGLIVLMCTDTAKCSSFMVLDVNIPLCIAMIVFIYSSFNLIKTLRAFRVKDFSEIDAGSYV